MTARQARIVTLNACHSASAKEDSCNLAKIFVQSGISHVMGMSYTLVESAAPLLMQSLFRSVLHDDMSFSLAVHASRRALQSDPIRAARFGKQVTLELDNYLVPVVYYSGSKTDPRIAPIRQSSSVDSSPILHQARLLSIFKQAAQSVMDVDVTKMWHWRSQPSSPKSFVMRDMDILNIERKLFLGSNASRMLLLHGAVGAGKTSLLIQVMEWWRKTNIIDGAFYFDFNASDAHKNPCTVAHIHDKLCASDLITSTAQGLSVRSNATTQLQDVLNSVRHGRHLFVFDHLEGASRSNLCEICQTGLPVFPDDQRGYLRQLFQELSVDSGQGLIILSTRRGDLGSDWLAGLELQTYELRGLPLFASMAIALKALHGDRSEKPTHENLVFMEHIVQLLDNLPLALEVVLPVLAKLGLPPKQLFHYLFTEHLFVGPICNINFPSTLFKGVDNLLLAASPNVVKMLLSTAHLWRRIPRSNLGHYVTYHAVDLRVEEFQLEDGFMESRNAFLIGAQGVMVDLGWWIPESEDYYRVNPLLQLFLQQKQIELHLQRQVLQFIRLTPIALDMDNFEQSFIAYHTRRKWPAHLHDTYFEELKIAIKAEFYSLVKVVHLATICLGLSDSSWPSSLALLLSITGQIPTLLSKNEQFLINHFIEGVLEKYEAEEQKYDPPALPESMLDEALQMFSATNDYYFVNDTPQKHAWQTDRTLAVADRACAAHGPLSAFTEHRRRYVLEYKGKQLIRQGKLKEAEALLKDNLQNSPKLEPTYGDPMSIYLDQLERNRQLSTYLLLPNLPPEERDRVDFEVRKGVANAMKLADTLGVSSMMEQNTFFLRGNTLEYAVNRPTRPSIPRSGIAHGFPEIIQEYNAKTVSRDDIERARVATERNMEKAMAENDVREQVRCQQQLAAWSMELLDFQRARQHYHDLLEFKGELSPTEAAQAHIRYSLCLRVVNDNDSEEWLRQHLEGLLMMAEAGKENVAQLFDIEDPGLMPTKDMVDALLCRFGFSENEKGEWEAPKNDATLMLAKELDDLLEASPEHLEEAAQGLTFFSGLSKEQMSDYVAEAMRRKVVLKDD